MNTFMVALIISIAISLLSTLTKQKSETNESSSVAYAIKIAVISFVCTYFGMMYFITPVCPEIIQGEPDF